MGDFMRLKGKSCVVTGAARGIGKAVGLRLVQEGANVVFADLNAAQAAEAAREAGKNGKATSVGVDVGNRDQVRAMIAHAVSEHGKLDIIFNNAGINTIQRFLDATEENFNRIMRVNALGVLICMQEAAKQMIEQGGGGKIINTVSIAGRQGYPDIAPYCASKFAALGLTQAAARALAPHRITVNGFSPGVVDTPLWEQLDREIMALGDSKNPGEAMHNFASSALVGRVSTPEDIVGLAMFLASADSDYITGQVITVDGGMVLH
jgi:meso-butanediol dehydrogenase/(S,S)-butanediol dehydrogenase/diacetyl reductase